MQEEIRRRLAESPRSAGALIEQIPVHRDAVLVYGALERLGRQGVIEPLIEGPGERLWGKPGTPAPAPRKPGPPATFNMSEKNQARIERAVWKLTDGLPGHYFEELRRAAVARADRLAYEGTPPDRAADLALTELGPAPAARRFLRSVARGKHPPLRLSRRRGRKLLIGCAVAFALLAAVRWFVLGVFRLPEGQVSMAPVLVPGVEGGDDLVLVNLLAYRFAQPERGDLVVFDAPGQETPYIKRVMGLPGEVVSIRDGDVWIDGERLVKDRAFLDRVRVPLFGMEAFERTSSGFRQTLPVHTGFVLPGGAVERRGEVAGDVVLEATLELADLQDSVTILGRIGKTTRHQVVLNAQGYGAGVFVGNRTIARGTACQLEPGRAYRLWLTNADGRFRVQLDGRELASAPLDDVPGDRDVRFEILGFGLRDARLSRDLVYTALPEAPDRWTLGQDAWFVLGDNSPVSRDSRTLGAIPGDALRGRAWRVAWPADRARVLR